MSDTNFHGSSWLSGFARRRSNSLASLLKRFWENKKEDDLAQKRRRRAHLASEQSALHAAGPRKPRDARRVHMGWQRER